MTAGMLVFALLVGPAVLLTGVVAGSYLTFRLMHGLSPLPPLRLPRIRKVEPGRDDRPQLPRPPVGT